MHTHKGGVLGKYKSWYKKRIKKTTTHIGCPSKLHPDNSIRCWKTVRGNKQKIFSNRSEMLSGCCHGSLGAVFGLKCISSRRLSCVKGWTCRRRWWGHQRCTWCLSSPGYLLPGDIFCCVPEGACREAGAALPYGSKPDSACTIQLILYRMKHGFEVGFFSS